MGLASALRAPEARHATTGTVQAHKPAYRGCSGPEAEPASKVPRERNCWSLKKPPARSSTSCSSVSSAKDFCRRSALPFICTSSLSSSSSFLCIQQQGYISEVVKWACQLRHWVVWVSSNQREGLVPVLPPYCYAAVWCCW